MKLTLFTLAVLALSTGVSYAFQSMFRFNELFIGISSVSLLITIIVVAIIRSTKIKYNQNIIDELTEDLDGFLSDVMVDVKCPCKHIIQTPIFPNDEFELICPKCDNTFLVIPSYETRLLTNPENISEVYDTLKKIKS